MKRRKSIRRKDDTIIQHETAGSVADVMSTAVEMIGDGESIQDAARIMAEQNIGFLPVTHDDRLVGVLTDRDIVLRVVAEGRDAASTPVAEAMTEGTKYCYQDEDLRHVAANMAEQHVCRLPVMDRDKRLVGVVSLEDIRPQHLMARIVAVSPAAMPGG